MIWLFVHIMMYFCLAASSALNFSSQFTHYDAQKEITGMQGVTIVRNMKRGRDIFLVTLPIFRTYELNCSQMLELCLRKRWHLSALKLREHL